MDDSTVSLMHLVGRAIYARRKALGLSQEALAEKVGIGQQSLSRMEQGKIAPKFERLQLFSDALQCRVMDLFMPPEATAESSAIALVDCMRPLTEEQRAFLLEQVGHWARFLACAENREKH